MGPVVVAGDEITTTASVKDVSERGGMKFFVFESVSENQRGETVCTGTWTQIVRGGCEPGRRRSSCGSRPDPYVTVRYAGASGDFNPIHIDEAFAKQVGLPGRILHGLWTMAQVARAHTEAVGGPEKLRRLSVGSAANAPLERWIAAVCVCVCATSQKKQKKKNKK